MGEIVNLRQARKAKSRMEAEKRAEENRVKFGRGKAEKSLIKAEAERASRAHAAGKRQIEAAPKPSDEPDA